MAAVTPRPDGVARGPGADDRDEDPHDEAQDHQESQSGLGDQQSGHAVQLLVVAIRPDAADLVAQGIALGHGILRSVDVNYVTLYNNIYGFVNYWVEKEVRMAAKKNTWVAIALVVAIGLAGILTTVVMQARSQKAATTKPQVLTTFTVLADMARNVAGDKADVDSITKPGMEIHGYEPTPADMVRLQKADVVLDNGLNLEKWAEKLYQNAKDVPHKTISEGVAPIAIAEGPYKDKPNPHAWMSPANALIYTDNIVHALSDVDPSNKTTYEQNGDVYKEKIRAIDQTLKNGLATLAENNRYLVTCEGAFTYLTRDYGLKEVYLWPINADAQGTPQQVRHVVETVKANNVRAVFCETTVSSKAQDQVASETSAHFGGKFYVDSLSGDDGPASTYLKMLEYNMSTLLLGLGEN